MVCVCMAVTTLENRESELPRCVCNPGFNKKAQLLCCIACRMMLSACGMLISDNCSYIYRSEMIKPVKFFILSLPVS